MRRDLYLTTGDLLERGKWDKHTESWGWRGAAWRDAPRKARKARLPLQTAAIMEEGGTNTAYTPNNSLPMTSF